MPIAVNAFSSDMVETRRISDIQSLSTSVPGFSINSLSKSRLNPSLRGGSSSLVSAGAEQAVGLFIDDQYFGGAGDFEIDLFDIERIEVLRGPQGTLFGRNTTGGSINVVTRRPSKKTEGKFEATIGNYDAIEARGYVSGPLAGNLFGSFAVSSRDRDGTSRNITTGNRIDNTNRASFRGKLLWEASPDLDIIATVGYSRADETGPARDSIFTSTPPTNQSLIDFGFVPDNDPRVVQQASDSSFKSRQWTGNLRAEYKLPDAALLSVTTYRDFSSKEGKVSLVGVPVPTFDLGEPRSAESFSQELRYTSDYDGPFNWVGGLYFFYSDETRNTNVTTAWNQETFGGVVQSITFCPLQTLEDFDNGVVTPACVANFPGLFGPNDFHVNERNRTTSYSAFVDGNYEPFEGFTLLGGLRYTHDKKKFNVDIGGGPDFFWNPPTSTDIDPMTGLPFIGQTAANSANWSKLTYRIGFQYKPTDKIMVYGTRSTGFRSGVFDGAQSDPTLVVKPVGPESATSHELGLKSRWFDNRFQLNIAVFNVEYTDLQFFISSPTSSVSTNAGKARVRGVEVEAVASITDYLTLSANYSHQDGTSSGIPPEAEITPGTAPQGTIPNTYMVAADFEYPLGNGDSFSAHVDLTHKDRYGLEFNDAPQFSSRTKSLVNASLNYKLSSGFEFSIWGQNLTNENIIVYGNDLWFASYSLAAALTDPAILTDVKQPRYSAPRTYGATIRYSF
ncbi:TonB-dependent receptor [Sphingobium sp. CECT 9361]|uniref:TonB-dependent receptor n=1 Tax=Sphingobium sp. CECT 9361 TaxID=2845384 RepID=UPI001E37A520|nr:TonB-dependent receptor [Sphingobium sp. CECT 9361]CAH0357248.1 Vitamin B12 transporter BtuB [Sphingobium sp. CECT 9361]